MRVLQDYNIGYVIEFDSLLGIGSLSSYSYFNFEDQEKMVKFNIIDSLIDLHIGKLVQFKIKPSHTVKSQFEWAYDIIEFDLELDYKLLSNFIRNVTDYSDKILPDNNPNLIDFFIEENKIHRKYSSDQFLIREAQKLIDNFENFDLSKSTEKYNIEIKEGFLYRPGGDDVAWIYIEAYNKYCNADPYVEKYLPLYSKKIISNNHDGSYSKMLKQMWFDLGGEAYKKHLIQELQLERKIVVERFKSIYTKESHKIHLENHLNQMKNNFYSKVIEGYNNRIILNKS